MPIEAILIKPLVDTLLALFRQANDITLKRNAEAALREAIRELLQADPNESRTEVRIAVAKAAGILSEDVVLAESLLKKHRAAKAKTRGKAATGRKRKTAPTPRSGKTADRNAPAKKTVAITAKKAVRKTAGRTAGKPAASRSHAAK